MLYAVLDRVVDDYQPVVDGLDEDIKEVETQVFSHEGSNPPSASTCSSAR